MSEPLNTKLANLEKHLKAPEIREALVSFRRHEGGLKSPFAKVVDQAGNGLGVVLGYIEMIRDALEGGRPEAEVMGSKDFGYLVEELNHLADRMREPLNLMEVELRSAADPEVEKDRERLEKLRHIVPVARAAARGLKDMLPTGIQPQL